MAPTEETIKKWKQEFFWLLFTKAQKLVCAVCTSQKEIIQSTRNFNDSMIHLLLAAQIIDYQACERVIKELSERRNTTKR